MSKIARVVDAYARRLFSRLGLAPVLSRVEGPPRDSYQAWQALFMEHLRPDASLFNEYHSLIVRHGKEACRRVPLCSSCPLLDICPTGAKIMVSRGPETCNGGAVAAS